MTFNRAAEQGGSSPLLFLKDFLQLSSSFDFLEKSFAFSFIYSRYSIVLPMIVNGFSLMLLCFGT